MVLASLLRSPLRSRDTSVDPPFGAFLRSVSFATLLSEVFFVCFVLFRGWVFKKGTTNSHEETRRLLTSCDFV